MNRYLGFITANVVRLPLTYEKNCLCEGARGVRLLSVNSETKLPDQSNPIVLSTLLIQMTTIHPTPIYSIFSLLNMLIL